MKTPWGHADGATVIADGIVNYTTPSHGGIKLSAERLAEMPEPYRSVRPFNGNTGWYEEDCDWVLVALSWPQYFKPGDVALARGIFNRCHAPKLALKTA